MISPKEALQRTIEHREIFYDEMVSLMRQIMQGEVSPVMSAAILAGLRVKKESIEEISAAAQVMRELSVEVRVKDSSHLLDIVGTGGDNSHTFNISTASMFVVSACGVKVAKHGNRGVSSKSGSADVLEALGVNIALSPEQIGECINQVGMGFMFAPSHHTAMKNVAAVRREMGVKTLFNILGPLTNPAKAPYSLMGVFHPDLVGIQTRVMKKLGAKRVLVVHGLDGLDEISLGAGTMIGELIGGEIREYTIHPEDYHMSMLHMRNLQVPDAKTSKAMIESILKNMAGPALETVALNAGAALYIANKASSIQEGIEMARQAIADGQAMAQLQALKAITHQWTT